MASLSSSVSDSIRLPNITGGIVGDFFFINAVAKPSSSSTKCCGGLSTPNDTGGAARVGTGCDNGMESLLELIPLVTGIGDPTLPLLLYVE